MKVTKEIKLKEQEIEMTKIRKIIQELNQKNKEEKNNGIKKD